MAKPFSLKRPAFQFLFGALLLASIGQASLAQSDHAWTLFPGLLLFTAAVYFFHFSLSRFPTAKESKSLSPRMEGILFGAILLLAFGFRIYRIDSLPAGMHTDQGLIGQCALRILHEGWRPFGEVFDYEVPEISLFYQMAGWFALVGSSYFTFHLFFVLLSLAAFPFIYWTFRQWAGPRVALFSLFLFAVMRWNWIETRNGYPSIQVPFYLFAALGLWTYWRKSGKKWAFALSALFVGAGFYTYQAFKIVPLLMALYSLYEFLRQKKKNLSLRPFLAYFLIVFVLICPLLNVMAQRGIIGHREADLFIVNKVVQEGSLKPLWDVWTGTFLMFNRQGDENPRHNIPGHRMLDDVTAVFFLLGLVLAWRRRKEPDGFYPLVGFGVMMLTGLLSTDIAHSNRLVSLTPFVAFFAGNALQWTWQAAKGFFKDSKISIALLAALLTGLTAQNAYTYFVLQADNTECQITFGLEQNFIGRMIEAQEKHQLVPLNYFIDPVYFGNHTVFFLTYPARGHVFPFNPQDWAKGMEPKDKPVFIYLAGGRNGWVDFIKTIFQDAPAGPYQDAQGRFVAYVVPIPKDVLQKARPWTKGLHGVYRNSNDWNAQPVAVRLDPVLNFLSKFDFPFTNFPPFRIRWTGTLEIPKAGDYLYQVLTTDQAQLWLDGKLVALEKPLALTAGPHLLRLDFEKDSGDALALHLVWKKPGADKWEVVPASAFGKLR